MAIEAHDLFDLPLGNYFDVVGLSPSSPLTPSLDTLNTLIHHHIHNIPFSSIEAFSGSVPSLKLEDIFEKLVVQQRGGWCFEQNTLFHYVLRKVGFTDVQFGLGRIMFGTMARNHCFNFVRLVEDGEEMVCFDG